MRTRKLQGCVRSRDPAWAWKAATLPWRAPRGRWRWTFSTTSTSTTRGAPDRAAGTEGREASRIWRTGRSPAAPDRRLFCRDAGTTFQRLPAVFAQLAPMPIGPATFAVEASAVQFGRFGEPDSRERTTGFGLTDRAIDPQVGSGDPSRAPAL